MTFLAGILARKRDEVAARRAAAPDREVEAALRDAPSPRDFAGALSPRGGPLRVVAEVKRASPSAGAISAGLDAVAQARRYAEGGAACISVLTDGPGFGGSLEDLAAVRGAVAVPLLRKDFVVDRYQLLEARRAGADAALLIVAALERNALDRLHDDALALGLAALVEVHDAREAEAALAAGARLVGVNNRDLQTFEVSVETSFALARLAQPGTLLVSESGLGAREQLERLAAAGFKGFLVGETLMRSDDPEAALRELTKQGE